METMKQRKYGVTLAATASMVERRQGQVNEVSRLKSVATNRINERRLQTK